MWNQFFFKLVLWIRIRIWVRMFLGLQDPDPIICTDPDTFIIKQEKKQKNLVYYYFVTVLIFLYLENWCKEPKKLVFRWHLWATVTQWYGSPDPYENVTDPQHCKNIFKHLILLKRLLFPWDKTEKRVCLVLFKIQSALVKTRPGSVRHFCDIWTRMCILNTYPDQQTWRQLTL